MHDFSIHSVHYTFERYVRSPLLPASWREQNREQRVEKFTKLRSCRRHKIPCFLQVPIESMNHKRVVMVLRLGEQDIV